MLCKHATRSTLHATRSTLHATRSTLTAFYTPYVAILTTLIATPPHALHHTAVYTRYTRHTTTLCTARACVRMLHTLSAACMRSDKVITPSALSVSSPSRVSFVYLVSTQRLLVSAAIIVTDVCEKDWTKSTTFKTG